MGKNADAYALMQKAAKRERSMIHRGNFLELRQEVIEGQVWELLHVHTAIAIIPIDNQGNLVLVEQWRQAIQKITIEIPAGLVDGKESLSAAAERELQEETGFKAGQLLPYGGCYSTPGITDEYIHLFLATDLTPGRLTAEDTDRIDVITLSVDRALSCIRNGTICDAKTIVGILKYVHSL